MTPAERNTGPEQCGRRPRVVFFFAFGVLATLAGLVLGIVEIAYRTRATP